MRISVGLTFPGNLKDESIICYVCKHFDINLNIIEASFALSSGWAFLELEGKKEEVERAFDYIASKGIKIQRIQTGQR